MIKTKLENLTKGDLISIRYGFTFMQVGVFGNNGQMITWRKIDYKDWANHSDLYSEFENYQWSHIGTFKKGLFKNKIELF